MNKYVAWLVLGVLAFHTLSLWTQSRTIGRQLNINQRQFEINEALIEAAGIPAAIDLKDDAAGTVVIDEKRRSEELPASEEAELKWPDTTSPAEDAEHGVTCLGLNLNGIHYKKAEVSPGRWQYVEDTEAMQRLADDDRRRRELMSALQTRVLTDEEMEEVEGHGRNLNIYGMEVYWEEDKQRELNEALYQQSRLRRLARTSPAEPAEAPDQPGADEKMK